jgi:hypothetical protein
VGSATNQLFPASVNSKRRAVRIINRAPRRDSILLTAFDTVAFESCNCTAASAKERHSATFAKMASPSRSGSLAMIPILETVGFDSFYF